MRKSSEVVVLGIETTAHTFGVGIFSNKRGLLANINDSYIPPEGGIHPREAAEHHASVAHEVLAKALSTAGLSIQDISAIAASFGPGLGPCLRVGCSVARALAAYFEKPLVPVNHCVAHIEIARYLLKVKDPLVVYVSGGNTIIAAYSDGRYRVFGETLDIALGNCLDVFAREIGLNLPGPPILEKYAEKGKRYIELPYVVKGQDLSLSGLLTKGLELASGGVPLEDLCFSFVETAYDMVVEVTERALAHTRKKVVVLTGGVARSKLLQRKLKEMCSSHSVEFKTVPKEYAGDNGGMIAYTGYLCIKHDITVPIEKSYIKPRWRLDEVDVPWFDEQ